MENKKNKNAIVTGTGFFNGTNGTIIGHEFENTSFSVSVIPTANPNGTVGLNFVTIRWQCKKNGLKAALGKSFWREGKFPSLQKLFLKEEIKNGKFRRT